MSSSGCCGRKEIEGNWSGTGSALKVCDLKGSSSQDKLITKSLRVYHASKINDASENVRRRWSVIRDLLHLKPPSMNSVNPLDARRRYTDFAQTSLRRRTAVYRPNGMLPHAPEDGIPAARCIADLRRKMVYNLCFLMHTGPSILES